MSLVRLLAIGKSLSPIKDKPNNYRLVRWGWPPKFCVPANPFAGTAQSAAASEPQQSPGQSCRQVSTRAAKPADAQRPDHAPSQPAGLLGRARLWLKSINPFSAKRQPKSNRHQLSRSGEPMQCELSLETVKVVRNDLSDSDVEVVPVRSAPAKSLAKIEAAMATQGVKGAADPIGAPNFDLACKSERPGG
ncbi:MAG: hypothetical protein NZ739_01770 [Verrucomicrobiae bacterium]|nr:hypothetical protein [Verrucomicrobiae bacterium]